MDAHCIRLAIEFIVRLPCINLPNMSAFDDKLTVPIVIPLTVQALPAILLAFCMYLCHESPRWLARMDRWEEAATTFSKIRGLPASHPYIQSELADIQAQLEHESALVGGATFWDLQKEMWLIPGNRKRALISIGLMICQQMTGTNASM
jgi:hypothetical protein